MESSAAAQHGAEAQGSPPTASLFQAAESRVVGDQIPRGLCLEAFQSGCGTCHMLRSSSNTIAGTQEQHEIEAP